jgi:hypothetical protein
MINWQHARHQQFQSELVKGRNFLDDQTTDRKIIHYIVTEWTVLDCIFLVHYLYDKGAIVETVWITWFLKIRAMSWLAKSLLASEQLCFTKPMSNCISVQRLGAVFVPVTLFVKFSFWLWTCLYVAVYTHNSYNEGKMKYFVWVCLSCVSTRKILLWNI